MFSFISVIFVADIKTCLRTICQFLSGNTLTYKNFMPFMSKFMFFSIK